MWSEVAQMHHLCCLILPDDLNAADYSGSLVNVITALAFLNQAKDDGHKGVITTAGNSATGRALLELARWKDVPVIALVRTAKAKKELAELGFTNVIDTSIKSFEEGLRTLAQQLGTTAIFEVSEATLSLKSRLCCRELQPFISMDFWQVLKPSRFNHCS